MPVNCPVSFNAEGLCSGCRHCFNDNCNYSILSPIPIEQILTDREYFLYLNKNIGGEVVHVHQPSINVLKELKRLDNDMQEHFGTHTDKKKVYNKYLP